MEVQNYSNELDYFYIFSIQKKSSDNVRNKLKTIIIKQDKTKFTS